MLHKKLWRRRSEAVTAWKSSSAAIEEKLRRRGGEESSSFRFCGDPSVPSCRRTTTLRLRSCTQRGNWRGRGKTEREGRCRHRVAADGTRKMRESRIVLSLPSKIQKARRDSQFKKIFESPPPCFPLMIEAEKGRERREGRKKYIDRRPFPLSTLCLQPYLAT